MIDPRVERLLNKAEAATDRGDIEQADTYRELAGHADYLRRREAKDLQRMLEMEFLEP